MLVGGVAGATGVAFEGQGRVGHPAQRQLPLEFGCHELRVVEAVGSYLHVCAECLRHRVDGPHVEVVDAVDTFV